MTFEKALEILDVDVNYDIHTIKKKYRTLIKELHPDANSQEDTKDQATQVILAYNLLKEHLENLKEKPQDDVLNFDFGTNFNSENSVDADTLLNMIKANKEATEALKFTLFTEARRASRYVFDNYKNNIYTYTIGIVDDLIRLYEEYSEIIRSSAKSRISGIIQSLHNQELERLRRFEMAYMEFYGLPETRFSETYNLRNIAELHYILSEYKKNISIREPLMEIYDRYKKTLPCEEIDEDILDYIDYLAERYSLDALDIAKEEFIGNIYSIINEGYEKYKVSISLREMLKDYLKSYPFLKENEEWMNQKIREIQVLYPDNIIEAHNLFRINIENLIASVKDDDFNKKI